MARAAQIVFSDGLKVRVDHNEADTRALADRLATSATYINLSRKEGGVIFVNGHTVAWIEDWPD